MECSKCGLELGNMQLHPEEVCRIQREQNRINLGLKCQWCNGVHTHAPTCPKSKSQSRPSWDGQKLVIERDGVIEYNGN